MIVLNDINALIWDIACYIYKESGIKIDFIQIQKILDDYRLAYTRRKQSEIKYKINEFLNENYKVKLQNIELLVRLKYFVSEKISCEYEEVVSDSEFVCTSDYFETKENLTAFIRECANDDFYCWNCEDFGYDIIERIRTVKDVCDLLSQYFD
jgi:regulator of replication initiation timing